MLTTRKPLVWLSKTNKDQQRREKFTVEDLISLSCRGVGGGLLRCRIEQCIWGFRVLSHEKGKSGEERRTRWRLLTVDFNFTVLTWWLALIPCGYAVQHTPVSHPKMLLCIFGLSVSSIFLQTHVIVIIGNLIGLYLGYLHELGFRFILT